MAHKNENIFSPTLCPDEQTLLLFVKGKLDESQKRAVEVHLTDCEMCSAYADGLSEMQNPDAIASIKEELDGRVDVIVKKKRNFSPIFFKIAASVLLISFLSVIIYKQYIEEKTQLEKFVAVHDTTDSSIALFDETETLNTDDEEGYLRTKHYSENQERTTISPAPIEILNIVEDDEDKFVKAARDKQFSQESQLAESKEIIRIKDEAPHEVERELAAVPAIPPISTATVNVDAAIVVAESVAQTRRTRTGRAESRQEETNTEIMSGISGKSIIVQDAEKPDLNDALTKINAKNYPEALQILKKLNQTDSVVYYTAFSLYNLNGFSDALKYFDKLKDKTSFAFYPEVQWYYANALISTNNLQMAADILREIIDDAGKFSQKAYLLLKEIEN